MSLDTSKSYFGGVYILFIMTGITTKYSGILLQNAIKSFYKMRLLYCKMR